MITEENCFEFILKVEPEFLLPLSNHMEEWGADSNTHSKMSVFSDFFEEKISQGNYSKVEEVLAAIEHLLVEDNSDKEVKEAVCTCFLENLINFASNQRIPYESFVPFLGKQSREFCRSWDKFTGVKTPGL